MGDILYRQECYDIIGAAMAVYNAMGHGFLESVYQECIEIELRQRNIETATQVRFPVVYRGCELRQQYVADLVCFGRIVVEAKATSAICDAHRAQVHNYLRASGMQLGILINFGHPGSLEYERIIRTNNATAPSHP